MMPWKNPLDEESRVIASIRGRRQDAVAIVLTVGFCIVLGLAMLAKLTWNW